ncbi:hypothetical protein CFR71_12510 [Novacetimonas pomaceti]|uniref:Uncharacterized protein n=1 Tax=Novacetimonas pomaceti TaxID=2021998 RepID=A0A318Q5P1_9PROT|nr:hypothetical protein CFR71_12510 [Novacetimonas pomaceti]
MITPLIMWLLQGFDSRNHFRSKLAGISFIASVVKETDTQRCGQFAQGWLCYPCGNAFLFHLDCTAFIFDADFSHLRQFRVIL